MKLLTIPIPADVETLRWPQEDNGKARKVCCQSSNIDACASKSIHLQPMLLLLFSSSLLLKLSLRQQEGRGLFVLPGRALGDEGFRAFERHARETLEAMSRLDERTQMLFIFRIGLIYIYMSNIYI